MRYEDLQPDQTLVWSVKEGVVTKAWRQGSSIDPIKQHDEEGEKHGDE